MSIAKTNQKIPVRLPPHMDVKRFMETVPEPLDFVLPGFVMGTVGGLISPGGAGKSTFALGACATIAAAVAGADLLGLGAVKPGKVVLFSGEDGVAPTHHRLHAVGKRLTTSMHEMILTNLVLIDCVGYGVDIINPIWQGWIRAQIAGARLIVIDTLTRFHSLDENESRDAKQIMGVLEGIASQMGVAVLYLHHISKSSALQGLGSLQQAARGSSVLVDNARWISFISGMSDVEAKELGVVGDDRRRFIKWNISKQNYAGARDDQWYVRGDGGVLLPISRDDIANTSPRKIKSTKKVASWAQSSGGLDENW